MPGFVFKEEEQITDVEFRAVVLQDITTSVETRDRKDEHLKRHEVFTDRARQWTLKLIEKEMGGKVLQEMEDRVPNFPLSEKVVGKLARVYKDAPTREITEGTPAGDQKKLDELVELSQLNRFMKKVNKFVELHFNTVAKVLPRESRDEPGKFEPSLQAVWPELYDVIPDPLDPTQPAVLIFAFYNDEPTDTVKDYRTGDSSKDVVADAGRDKGEPRLGSTDKNKHFVWWSEHFNFITDGAGELVSKEGMENELGFLPCTNFAKEQGKGFWAEGGEDITDNTILGNLLVADFNYTSKFQSAGIAVLTGDDPPANIKMGANRILVLPYKGEEKKPELTFANSGADLQGMMAGIEQHYAMSLSMAGLESGAASIKLDGKGGATSGVQEVVQKAEPKNITEDEQALYKAQEPELVKSIIKVVNKLNEKGILSTKWQGVAGINLEKFGYNLGFPEVKPFMTDKEKLELINAKRASGLYTEDMLLRQAHPDLKEAELEALKVKLAEEKEARVLDAQKMMGPGVPLNEDVPANETPEEKKLREEKEAKDKEDEDKEDK